MPAVASARSERTSRPSAHRPSAAATTSDAMPTMAAIRLVRSPLAVTKMIPAAATVPTTMATDRSHPTRVDAYHRANSAKATNGALATSLMSSESNPSTSAAMPTAIATKAPTAAARRASGRYRVSPIDSPSPRGDCPDADTCESRPELNDGSVQHADGRRPHRSPCLLAVAGTDPLREEDADRPADHRAHDGDDDGANDDADGACDQRPPWSTTRGRSSRRQQRSEDHAGYGDRRNDGEHGPLPEVGAVRYDPD